MAYVIDDDVNKRSQMALSCLSSSSDAQTGELTQESGETLNNIRMAQVSDLIIHERVMF